MGKYVKKVIGIEPFKPAFERSVTLDRRPNVFFLYSLIENFNIKERFDLAISLTTIEHMPRAEKSFKQIFKLMKEKSVLYITAPNKLWPLEPHYSLFFLSWLPLPIANIYLRITKKGQSYKESSYSRTYFGMSKLFDKFGYEYSFVLPDSSSAAYLGCGTQSLANNILRRFGIWLIRKIPLFWVISKGFIMVIRKK